MILSSIPYGYAFKCYYCLINDFEKLNETMIECQKTYLNGECCTWTCQKSFDAIQISDNNLTLLPNLVEQIPKVSGIKIVELKMSKIDTNICKWKNLDQIIFRNNSLKTLPSGFLSKCQKLRQLDLSRNLIFEIEKDTFNNLLELSVLDLSFNQLKTLHKNTFKPLSKLIALYLTGNQLQTIDVDLFYHNVNILVLDFRNNDLRIIKKTFRMLKNIYFLNIDGNRYLKHIDLPNTSINNLRVNISNCNLKTLVIPPNIAEIYALYNQISFVKIHPDNELNILDISHNNLIDITHISNIRYLKKLHYLNIMHNEFRYIDFSELCRLKQMQNLLISSSSLTFKKQIGSYNDCKRHGISVYINDPYSITYNVPSFYYTPPINVI